MKRFAVGLFAALISVTLVVPAFAVAYADLETAFRNVNSITYQMSSTYHEGWNKETYESTDIVFLMEYQSPRTIFLTKVPNAVVSRNKYNGHSLVTSDEFVCSRVFWTNPSDPTDVIYTQSASFVNIGYPGTYDPELVPIRTVIGSEQVDAIALAFEQFLSEYTPPLPQTDKSIVVPIGYAAYLKASGTLTLRCTFPSNSNLVSTGHGWWGETRQTLGSADSLPSDSFQPSGVQIVWARDSALSALGVLGTTKHAYSEHAAMSPWTVIVNPVNKYLALGSDQNTRDSYNGPITVSGTIGEFRLYPLAGSWSPSTGLEDDGSGSDYIDVNIDPETGEPIYTDPDGNVVTPPVPGGSTALPEAVSSTSLVQRIVGILSDLVNRIEGIFSVAYQAISNLVGLAGPFVAKLSALYSWLPAPVLSALSSAMILAITIGVLKVFL